MNMKTKYTAPKCLKLKVWQDDLMDTIRIASSDVPVGPGNSDAKRNEMEEAFDALDPLQQQKKMHKKQRQAVDFDDIDDEVDLTEAFSYKFNIWKSGI